MPTSAAYRILDTDVNAAHERDRARSMGPDQLIGVIEASGLRGRGGAGFPLARKLATARAAAAGGSAYVVANAYDADPGSPLARTILLKKPELVIEGLAIAAAAVGATSGYLYLRPDAESAKRAADRALEAARPTLGDLEIEVALGPGGFMGGEESALLAVLESRRAMARQRPPYPARQGLLLRPTVVSSAETLAALPLIVRDGAKAFRRVGTESSPGTKLVSVTGAVASPGVYEVAFGETLGDIVSRAGGATGGTLKGLHVGGPTGGILNSTRTGVALDYASLKAAGTHLGSAQIRVIGPAVCIVNEAAKLFDYLAKETCGICVPCRVGTKRVEGILEGIYSDLGRADDLPWLGELANHLEQFSLCGFGITSASILKTTMSEFADDYRSHIDGHACPTGTCRPARSRRYETMAQP
ncbi:MAG TPA: NADH-ubiquinone oxidoreductase-F iron-sulfur binding region domain-containing protein [Candidatus Saccharimonadales bacterium]|nr:NADH-ubiquinone oxidoreductase-F iron-sulfur binding region domain-containing protein [Candidatus Saccharimonadales bacterium]